MVHDGVCSEYSGCSETCLFWLQFETETAAVYGGNLLLSYKEISFELTSFGV